MADCNFVVETCDDCTEVVVERREELSVEFAPPHIDLESACQQGPVGPQGPQGPPGIPGDNIVPVTIPASLTYQVDFVPADVIEGIEWRLVGRVPTGEMRFATVFVSWDDSWNTYRTVYARGGAGFARFDIGVTHVFGIGNNIQLYITNNHTDDLTIYGTRYEVSGSPPP